VRDRDQEEAPEEKGQIRKDEKALMEGKRQRDGTRGNAKERRVLVEVG